MIEKQARSHLVLPSLSTVEDTEAYRYGVTWPRSHLINGMTGTQISCPVFFLLLMVASKDWILITHFWDYLFHLKNSGVELYLPKVIYPSKKVFP